jgi:hypothetical protein
MKEIRLKLEKFLEQQVAESGVHGINACDIIVDYMNTVLLEEEVEEIKERIDFELKTASSKNRKCIAEDSNTPVETLVQLSRDEEWGVRWRAAKNPNTPVEALVRLSRDEEWGISEGVADNPKWTEPTNQERIKELKELMDLEKELGVELF